MRKPGALTEYRVVSVISDALVMEIACDDARLEEVLVGVQHLLMSLDIDLALMSIGSASELADVHGEAEKVRRAAALN
jgi:hypothetical protein